VSGSQFDARSDEYPGILSSRVVTTNDVDSDHEDRYDLLARRAALLELLQNGLDIVPLFGASPGSDGHLVCDCSDEGCEHPGKHPRLTNWPRRASENESIVMGWLVRWPRMNVGVVTGNIVVIDFDPRNGSESSEAGLVEKHGPWPATPTVVTPGGGRHLYFDVTGLVIGNSLQALRGVEGIDVRGRGGLAVAPPSSGYSWSVPLSVGFARLPAWLELGCPRDLEAADRPPNVTGYGWAALTSEYRTLVVARERNNSLYASARKLGQLVAGGEFPEEVAMGILSEAGELLGLGATEIRDTIRSGFKAGSLHPRHSRPIATREQAQQRLNEIRQTAHSQKWKGHKGKRDITALEALIRIGMRQGGPNNIAAGIRKIAIEGGMSTKPVLVALDELESEGWVTCIYTGKSGDSPSRWTVRIPPHLEVATDDDQMSLQSTNGSIPCIGEDVGGMQHSATAIGHDVFRRQKTLTLDGKQYGSDVWTFRFKGLDKTAWRVLELLKIESLPSYAEIGRRLGVHRSTAKRATDRLLATGLAVLDEGGNYVGQAEAEELGKIAERLGLSGASQRQRDSYGWIPVANLVELESCPHDPPCEAY